LAEKHAKLKGEDVLFKVMLFKMFATHI